LFSKARQHGELKNENCKWGRATAARAMAHFSIFNSQFSIVHFLLPSPGQIAFIRALNLGCPWQPLIDGADNE
jgi:hypothetical protein